jgi:hypothetical protein
MFKKLIMSCMAVAAFAAFVLPATASATNDPQLTEGVTLVPAGTKILGTAANTEFITTAGANLVTCSSATMTGTLLKNSGSTVEGEIPAASAIFQGTGAINAHNNRPECTGSFGNAYITVNTALCIRSDSTMATDEFRVNGGACGSGGKVTFTIGSTTAGPCKYLSTGAIRGTYTTGGTEAKLSTIPTSEGSGATLEEGSFLCPHSGALRMTFSLETDVSPFTKLTIS